LTFVHFNLSVAFHGVHERPDMLVVKENRLPSNGCYAVNGLRWH